MTQISPQTFSKTTHLDSDSYDKLPNQKTKMLKKNIKLHYFHFAANHESGKKLTPLVCSFLCLPFRKEFEVNLKREGEAKLRITSETTQAQSCPAI